MRSVADLGANLTPVAVNNNGDVAAVSTNGAVLIKNGTVTNTGLTPVFYDTGYSMGLNDSDQVVAGNLWSNGSLNLAQGISFNGQYVAGWDASPNAGGESSPTLWNLATGQATDLGGDGFGEALGVNNSGGRPETTTSETGCSPLAAGWLRRRP